jgi:hypothetical protein
MMTNREHIAKILTRSVSAKEIHAHINDAHEIQDEIRTREALLFLAESIDELGRNSRSHTHNRSDLTKDIGEL